MKLHTISRAALAVVTSGLLQNAGAQFLNKSAQRTGRRISVVLLLPVQVSLVGYTAPTTWKPGKRVPAVEEADRLGEELYTFLSEDLRSHGVNVLANPLATASSDEMRYRVADLQQKYDVMEPQMVQKPKDIVKGRFTLGDDVAAFEPNTQADTLVFVRGSGAVRVGRGTFLERNNIVKPRQPFEGRITFVDAHSGDVIVLATFSTEGLGGWDGTAKELMPAVRECLAKSPAAIYSLLGP